LVQIGADKAAKQSCHLGMGFSANGNPTYESWGFGHTQKAAAPIKTWRFFMGLVTSQNGTRKKIT
jgi:hypothetical protein